MLDSPLGQYQLACGAGVGWGINAAEVWYPVLPCFKRTALLFICYV